MALSGVFVVTVFVLTNLQYRFNSFIAAKVTQLGVPYFLLFLLFVYILFISQNKKRLCVLSIKNLIKKSKTKNERLLRAFT